MDTNSSWLGRKLVSLGVCPTFHQTTRDDMAEIVSAFRLALSRSDVVLSTGGLGPTSDDMTFEAAANALNLETEFYPETFRRIEKRFQDRGLPCPEANRKQAMLPKGAVEIPNSWGTAPACQLDIDNKTVFLLPGVPREMKPLFELGVQPVIEKHLGENQKTIEQSFQFFGISESLLGERIDGLRISEAVESPVQIAYTATFPYIDVTLSLPRSTSGEDLSKVNDLLLASLGEYLACGGHANFGIAFDRTSPRKEMDAFYGGVVYGRNDWIPNCECVRKLGCLRSWLYYL